MESSLDKDEKHPFPAPDAGTSDNHGDNPDVHEGEIAAATGSQHLQRKLRGREVQLFAVGGAIGTCMRIVR
jgi:amino acid transporter